MKKFLMIAALLSASMSASAHAAFVFQGQPVVGPYLNCTVGNNTVMPYRVVQIQYDYSCADVYGRVFGYRTLNVFNDIASYVNPGMFKTFPGPALVGCNVVAAACTVLGE